MNEGNNMKTTKIMGLTFIGALTAGGIAAAGWGAGVAQADLHDWCPGQPLPNPTVNWEMDVCHNYDVDQFGNVESIAVHYPPGVPAPPPPPASDYCVVNPIGCHFFGEYGPGSHG
jgi:hypothetical protein